MNPNQSSKKRRLPSLWEILGAFVAILVIAAVLFPVLAKSHYRNTHSTCSGNEKQLGIAFAQYLQDNDNAYPIGTASDGCGVGWGSEIYNYAKAYSIFWCYDDLSEPVSEMKPISYALSANIVGRKYSAVAKPSRTVVLFEITGVRADLSNPADANSPVGRGLDGGLIYGTSHSHDGIKYETGYLGKRPPLSISQFAAPTGRHNGGSNFLFADSHAKWLKPEQVSSGFDAATKTAPQTGGVIGNAAGTANPNYAGTFSTK